MKMSGDMESERLQDIYERLDELDAATAETKAARLLHGLGQLLPFFPSSSLPHFLYPPLSSSFIQFMYMYMYIIHVHVHVLYIHVYVHVHKM